MAAPRRNIVRPPLSSRPASAHPHQRDRLRGRLERERLALARWQKRLRRAFNAVQKHQKAITLLERQLSRLEE